MSAILEFLVRPSVTETSPKPNKDQMIGNPLSRRAFGSYFAVAAGAAFISLKSNPVQPQECLLNPNRRSIGKTDLNRQVKCNVQSPLMRAVFASFVSVGAAALLAPDFTEK